MRFRLGNLSLAEWATTDMELWHDLADVLSAYTDEKEAIAEEERRAAKAKKDHAPKRP
jgi:hypothetical protein